jgi:hypothetical protein
MNENITGLGKKNTTFQAQTLFGHPTIRPTILPQIQS